MSSINSINSGFNLSQIGSYTSINQQGGDSDGDRGNGIGRGGLFANALVQALTQIGVSGATSTLNTSSGNTSSSSSNTGTSTSTGTSSSTATNSTQDPQQALSAFMHDLFAALHAQGTQTASANPAGGTDSDGDNDGSSTAGISGASGTGRHHHGGGLNGVENRLQSLIQQLSSSSNSSSTGSSTDSTTTNLQQDFQNLLASFGASGNQTSLTNFLQALSSNLQGNNPGLNVSTTA